MHLQTIKSHTARYVSDMPGNIVGKGEQEGHDGAWSRLPEPFGLCGIALRVEISITTPCFLYDLT